MATSMNVFDRSLTGASREAFIREMPCLSKPVRWRINSTPARLAEVSRLLTEWGAGDPAALDKLMPLVYDELRRLAHRLMSRERSGHTLQTTALVDEAYLRLADQRDTQWKNRAQFFSIAARLMRRILVDHARSHRYAKRGGGAAKVPLEEAGLISPERPPDLIALDCALERMSALDPRKCRIVELRYFTGLTVEETAEILGVSPITVKRDWLVAKAWLRREMTNETQSLE